MAERTRIDQLLKQAHEGESGVLVVRGEAGIGKTALLGYALERAEGMVVLRAQGVESESHLSFVGLSDLLRPTLSHLGDLPAPQAAALAGALATGPPVAGDRFAVSAATLSLLSAVAEEGPVLAVVDDAQWLDGSSAEALAFTARRLQAEGIVLLFGLRDGETVDQLLAGLPDLRVRGLGDDDATRLLTSRAGDSLTSLVARQLVAATAGNPLALLELPTVLSDRQLSGREPLDDPLQVGRTVEEVFLRRIVDLPEATQQALVVAAASGSASVIVVKDAVEMLGGRLQDLEAAETVDLLAIGDGRVEFRHPLVRSATYHGAPAAMRRAAHRALAETTPAGDHERRAWHHAAAALGPDETVAVALEAAATSASERRSHAAASRALERAARLTASGHNRCRRLLAAADNAQLAGQINNAMRLLDEALEAGEPGRLRAEIQHLRGRILTWSGAPVQAHRLLLAEERLVEVTHPGQAAAMLVSATLSCLLVGDTASAMSASELGARLAGRQKDPEVSVTATLLSVLTKVIVGQTVDAHRLLVGCKGQIESCDPLSAEQPMLIAALCHMTLEDFAEARKLTELVVGAARAASAIGLLPFQLAWLSVLDYRAGRWASALAGAHDAIRLAEETGWLTELPNAFVALAQVEAGQGREDCRTHAWAALGVAESIGAVLLEVRALGVLGLLELGLGQPQTAIGHLEKAARLAEEHQLREPGNLQCHADLVEAYMRLGRIDDAAAALDLLEHQVTRTGLRLVRAHAARCRGLMGLGDAESQFAAAIELHEQVPIPFERARTELCYGETLRRSKRRAEARRWLRSALEEFERLGAAPWADRARAELRLTGERLGRRDVVASQRLTPQDSRSPWPSPRGQPTRTPRPACF